jgi:hypothetical protein
MPVKIARSAARPSFGLRELLVAIHTSRQSCSKAGKARIFPLVWESSGESRLMRSWSPRRSPRNSRSRYSSCGRDPETSPLEQRQIVVVANLTSVLSWWLVIDHANTRRADPRQGRRTSTIKILCGRCIGAFVAAVWPSKLLTSRHQLPYVLMHEDDPDT